MEKITIADVTKMSDGMPVDKVVSGEITYVGSQKEDNYKNQKQGIAIKDATGSVWVEIKNHTAIPREANGKIISIEGWYDETHRKWMGLSKSSYEKEGKTQHKLSVTQTGKFTIDVSSNNKKEESRDNSSNSGKSNDSGKDSKKDEKQTEKSLPQYNKNSNNSGMTKEEWQEKGLIANRGIAMSYAVEAFKSGVIRMGDIPDFAEMAVVFMYGKKDECSKIIDVILNKYKDSEGK